MSEFEIDVSDKTAPNYEVADNIAENIVDVIRSEMVGNEAEFLATAAGYASGLSIDPDEYLQLIIRGKSGEGKTKLKQTQDKIWVNDWLLRTGSTSDMGLVDSDRWNKKYIGAFAEFQQMQGKMLEMVKSSAGDDADENGVGFQHSRNVDDGDGGREEDVIEKQAMPTVFLFADENNADIPKELETRQMVIRVEADEDINRAVGKTMFDHREVEVTDREHTYNFNFDEGTRAVQDHIANIPRPLESTVDGVTKSYARPVIIPHSEDIDWPTSTHPDIESYGWDTFEVMGPIFNWGKTDSKRAAKAVGNHIRSWTRMNYHSRETMNVGGTEYLVAEPQDIGNVLSYRHLLLNLTHGMDEQRLAVIDALTDEHNGVGGHGPNGGLQATRMDIAEYIDDYADIPSLSKDQLSNSRDKGVLDEMEDEYLIVKHEGDGPNGAHMYEFLGGSTFGHPNLDVYPELFEPVTDPIRDQHIAETVNEFEAELSATTEVRETENAAESLAPSRATEPDTNDDTDDADEGLSAFSDDDDEGDVEWREVDAEVAQHLENTIDDKRVTPDDVQSLDTQHMLGISPVEYYTNDEGLQYVRAERERRSDDKNGSIMDPSHHMWADKSEGQVADIVENAIAKLTDEEVMQFFDEENGDSYIVVNSDEVSVSSE